MYSGVLHTSFAVKHMFASSSEEVESSSQHASKAFLYLLLFCGQLVLMCHGFLHLKHVGSLLSLKFLNFLFLMKFLNARVMRLMPSSSLNSSCFSIALNAILFFLDSSFLLS